MNDYSYELLQLIIVWNALKTSRNVLGAEMPMAEEAQKYETRVEEVLTQGVEAMDKLMKREGKSLNTEITKYIKDGVERCR
jgi:uncharacterized FlaG/YvyC family protein